MEKSGGGRTWAWLLLNKVTFRRTRWWRKTSHRTSAWLSLHKITSRRTYWWRKTRGENVSISDGRVRFKVRRCLNLLRPVRTGLNLGPVTSLPGQPATKKLPGQPLIDDSTSTRWGTQFRFFVVSSYNLFTCIYSLICSLELSWSVRNGGKGHFNQPHKVKLQVIPALCRHKATA